MLRLWQPMLTCLHHSRRCSMPSEAAEPLPCGRIEDRRHSPKGRFACDWHLPKPRPSRTEGLAPKRDEPALSLRPSLQGSLGKPAAWLGEKNHMRSDSPVVAASLSQFLFEAILAEWLKRRRPSRRLEARKGLSGHARTFPP